MSGIRRREFVTLLGGAAAAWPLAARAQQPAMPVIGFFNSASCRYAAFAALPQGPQRSRLCRGPERDGGVPLAEEPIRSPCGAHGRPRAPARGRYRHAAGNLAALAAKAATTTTPIVFGVAEDPVKLGLVASLNRPGSNLTGINFFG